MIRQRMFELGVLVEMQETQRLLGGQPFAEDFVFEVVLRKSERIAALCPPCRGEGEQLEARNVRIALRIARPKDRIHRNCSQQMLERRRQMSFIEYQERVNAQQPRMIRAHLPRNSVALKQKP